MLTRRLGRQSLSVTRHATTTSKDLKDPWSAVFDGLPDIGSSGDYSRLAESREAPKRRRDYFSKNFGGPSNSRFFNPNPRRSFSTSAVVYLATEASASEVGKPGTSTSQSWDAVFDDLEGTPNLTPLPSVRPSLLNHSRKPRRQTMTAREINAFEGMFSMIFDAVSPDKTAPPGPHSRLSSIGGGLHSFGLGFGAQRKRLDLPRPLTEEEERLLDVKKEEMEGCYTDLELLQWGERELFADSMERLKAHEESSTTPPPSEGAADVAAADASSSSTESAETPSTAPTSSKPPLTSSPSKSELQNPLYAPLLAHLLSLTLHKFRNPSLAMSLFQHAAALSLPSYIHACTTSSYNVYLEALWTHTQDVKAMSAAVEEMWRNGVKRDGATRKMMGVVRREVERLCSEAEKISWEIEKGAEGEGEGESSQKREVRFFEIPTGEVFQLMEQMESICIESHVDNRPSSSSAGLEDPWREPWKDEQMPSPRHSHRGRPRILGKVSRPRVVDEGGDDADSGRTRDDKGWEFDDWEMPLPQEAKRKSASSGVKPKTKPLLADVMAELEKEKEKKGVEIDAEEVGKEDKWWNRGRKV